MTFSVAERRRARQRAELDAEHLRPRQRQADAAQAEERIALASMVSPAIGLSPPASSVRIDDRPAAAHSSDPAIGAILRLLVGQAVPPVKQEFGAHQADAVADRGVERSRARPGRATLTITPTGVPSAVAAGLSKHGSFGVRRSRIGAAPATVADAPAVGSG